MNTFLIQFNNKTEQINTSCSENDLIDIIENGRTNSYQHNTKLSNLLARRPIPVTLSENDEYISWLKEYQLFLKIHGNTQYEISVFDVIIPIDAEYRIVPV